MKNTEKTECELILSHVKDVYAGKMLKMSEVPCSHLSTDNCKMLCLFIGDNPESTTYGKMKGIFEYQDGRIFLFSWHIHEPNQKYASLSNHMTNIEQLVVKYDEKHDFTFVDHEDLTLFGNEAFMLYTPTHTLSGEDYGLRMLMKSIKAWAVKEQLCKKLRSTDKAHIKWSDSYYKRKSED